MYRVAELAEGWTGHLIRQQWLFVGFEGVMVIVACLALNIFNPAFAFSRGMEGAGGLGKSKKRSKKDAEKTGTERSASNSDVEAANSVKVTGGQTYTN